MLSVAERRRMTDHKEAAARHGIIVMLGPPPPLAAAGRLRPGMTRVMLRRRLPLAQEAVEFDAFAQAALHHLRRAHHLPHDRSDLRSAEIEAAVKVLDRVEN